MTDTPHHHPESRAGQKQEPMRDIQSGDLNADVETTENPPPQHQIVSDQVSYDPHGTVAIFLMVLFVLLLGAAVFAIAQAA